MAENAIVSAIPNYVLGAQTGTDVAASTPIEYIFHPEPSQYVQFTNPVLSLQHWIDLQLSDASFDLRADDIEFFAIVNHNLTQGAAEFMFDVWDINITNPAPLGSFVETPDAIAASSNLSGVVGSIDEDPDSPDGNWLTATSGTTDTSVRVTFTTGSVPASADIRTGAKRQEFRCYLRRTSGSAPFPTAQVDLYENGVFVRTLVTAEEINSTTGQIVSGYWDFSEVSGWANVECRVAGDASAASTVEIGAIRWIVDADPDDAILYSSGWQTVDASDAGSLFGGANADAVGAPPNRNQPFLPASSITGTLKTVMLHLRDASNADGFLKIGIAIVGAKFQPEKNVGAVKIRARDPSSVIRTAGGQRGGANQRRERIFDVEWTDLSKAEAFTLFDRLDWRKGTLIPFLVCLFPDDTMFRAITTSWVTLESSDGIEEIAPLESGATTSADHRWRARYSFVEKL